MKGLEAVPARLLLAMGEVLDTPVGVTPLGDLLEEREVLGIHFSF